MEDPVKIFCPICKNELIITFPESFYFNVVSVECSRCGFKDSNDGYSNNEALKALEEIIERYENESKN